MILEMDFENRIDHDAGTEPMREQQRYDARTTGCNTLVLPVRATTAALKPENGIPGVRRPHGQYATSSYGLPLTRGGALRCTPALQAAAPRCWDSPTTDGLHHACFAGGGDNDGGCESKKAAQHCSA